MPYPTPSGGSLLFLKPDLTPLTFVQPPTGMTLNADGTTITHPDLTGQAELMQLPNGQILIAEIAMDKIIRLNEDGSFVDALSLGTGCAGCPHWPAGMTLDKQGRLLVSTGTNQVVVLTFETTPADTTPPVITPTVSGSLGSNGWYTSNVTVSWAVVDNESSITDQSGCDTTTVTTDTLGVTFTCSATSSGGTASNSVTIQRDATQPTITGNISPAANSNGWHNSSVTVSFTCNDATSGIATCTTAQTLGEGANQSLSGTATDKAGNQRQNSSHGH